MPTVIKRCISLLLILMLVVSLIPSVYAAETADEADPAASTETMEETTNTEPEENLIPPPDETESPVTEESVTEPSDAGKQLRRSWQYKYAGRCSAFGSFQCHGGQLSGLPGTAHLL